MEQLQLDAPSAASPESAPAKRGRGRPRIHADAAARQAAYRERHGLVTKTMELPAHVAEAFAAYMYRHVRDGEGLTESQVLAKLIERQLCRKR